MAKRCPICGWSLTERQTLILKLLASGKNAKQIAGELRISAKTVETHRAAIYEALGVSDLTALVRYAIKNSLIGIGE